MAKKIAVLMGGRSLEREISLQSGARVVAALEARGHHVLALDLVPKLVDTLRSERPDAVYITLHGKFGEDGMIQELLEFLKIPYTGPGVLASMLAWDKDLTKRLFLTNDIPTPPWIAFSAEAIKEMGAASALDLVGEEIGGFPVAVKPAEQGSALGLSRVSDAKGLAEAMLTGLGYDSKVLVEKWIDGTEIAIPILDGPNGTEALPAVEIAPKAGLYDYESMYTPGETEYFVPARLPEDVAARATEIATRVYTSLGCRDVSRVDMVVAADGTPYVLECSTSPGLTETSVLAMSAEAAGISFEEYVDRIVSAALARG
ncbi:MAG: D-alanine--D-alanine ligase [Coriobacteriia bacterium]|nr:D-alanine--D-alanine ligase [Coriobacteriia bacterium]